MADLEQQYYEMLTRTDHPVFRKDFAEVQDASSPFNSVLNRILARQFVKLSQALDTLQLNAYPNTVDTTGIDKWEETFFGFVKSGVPFLQRVNELLRRYNHQITMSVGDVVFFAEVITGQTPVVMRNLYFGGFILDVSVLDLSTIFSGADQSISAQDYVVAFSKPVDSGLLKILDKELTRIEKGGSRHFLVAPPNFWVLDVNTLNVDTILG